MHVSANGVAVIYITDGPKFIGVHLASEMVTLID